MLGAVHAEHYLFSANSAIFNHPDDEAVTRCWCMAAHSRRCCSTMRPSDRTQRWAEPALRAKYGYQARYPEAQAGVTVELAGRAA